MADPNSTSDLISLAKSTSSWWTATTKSAREVTQQLMEHTSWSLRNRGVIDEQAITEALEEAHRAGMEEVTRKLCSILHNEVDLIEARANPEDEYVIASLSRVIDQIDEFLSASKK